ncbi:PP2C family protein-serine/threonine phosphatase [bacterium]
MSASLWDKTHPSEDESGNTKLLYGATNTGQTRTHNEDAFFMDDHIWVVTDGMGGHNAGEVASQKTITYIKENLSIQQLSELNVPDNQLLSRTLFGAHLEIIRLSQENPEYRGMGCTVVIASLLGSTLHVCHVGDARAYIVNADKIQQIGTDHSHVAEAVLAGQMTRDEARLSDMKNLVTQAIGGPNELHPEYLTAQVNPNDRILLCSDGLWDMLSDEEIKNLIMADDDAQHITQQLISEANRAGGLDNITVIMAIVH